ncbi:hypothetical protein GWK91_01225 [Virgibacillus sp. MSP4-1]|uniref:hypothetical protein n=1 Tax=Virgibacillus sp. MSP4-1 TaxID=2700081 RepID=UPI0003A94C3C|nr:hypothetical protein [Virgibacillus sp. MSP4-1]QHS21656.1 hypothetical protein GWK91_01225 [Virgibacillus sp. MSP4-1]
MKGLRQKLFWIIPFLIILTGFILLFVTNLQRFTAPPAEGWSRGLEVAKMDGFHDPQVEADKSGMDLYFLRDGSIHHVSYDTDFSKKGEDVIPVDRERVDSFYVYGDRVYYFDEGSIINGKTGEGIDEAEIFHRGEEGIIYYSQGQNVFQFNLKTEEKKKIFSASHPFEEIQVSGPYVLVYTSDLNEGILSIFKYQEQEKSYTEFTQTTVDVGMSNRMNEMVFTAGKDKLHLAVSAETQSKQNKDFYFFYSSVDTDQPEIELVELEPKDPVTQTPLQEISQFQLRTDEEGTLEVLFRSAGFTFTDTNDEQAMNAYHMKLGPDQNLKVERRSNTYSLTSRPFFIGGEAIGWKDRMDGSEYQLLMSSSHPNMIEKTNHRSLNEYLIAFGISIGDLSTAAFILYLVLILILIPVLYFGVTALYYRWKGNRDGLEQNPKVFYGGVIVYTLGALLLRNHLFPDNAYAMAPGYISFPGNDLVFILGFSLLSLVSILLVKRDWGLIGKYSYFIGLQFLFYVLFLGPYYF